jgi:hypothetical protein
MKATVIFDETDHKDTYEQTAHIDLDDKPGLMWLVWALSDDLLYQGQSINATVAAVKIKSITFDEEEL